MFRLALPQGLFGAPAFGDIAGDGLQEDRAVPLEADQADLGWKCGAIGAAVHPFEMLGGSRQRVLDSFRRLLGGISSIRLEQRRELEGPVQQNLLAGPPKHPDRRRIAFHAFAVFHDENGGEGGLKQDFEFGLRARHRGRGTGKIPMIQDSRRIGSMAQRAPEIKCNFVRWRSATLPVRRWLPSGAEGRFRLPFIGRLQRRAWQARGYSGAMGAAALLMARIRSWVGPLFFRQSTAPATHIASCVDLSACMVRPITLRWVEVATRRRVAHDLRILRSGEKRP